MKRFFIVLSLLTLGGIAHAANSSLTVSSGTFLAVDGFTTAGSQFRQTVTIGDPSVVANVAPVDAVKGLEVYLASSTASIGTLSATQNSLVDGSTTTTAINTSQQVFSGNSSRHYLFIQNDSTATICMNFNIAAATGPYSNCALGNIVIPANNNAFTMESLFVSTQAINIASPSSGMAVTAKQF